MSQSATADRCPRAAAALLRHPAVAAATVVEGPDGRLVARVALAAGSGRFPAVGRCALIEAGGAVVEGELVDVSWSGLRLRAAAADRLAIDAEVQLWIEAGVLGGGIDGWLGRVRWIRGSEVGVAFAGNFDEGMPLVRLVEAFATAAADGVAERPQVDARTRAAVHRGAVLRAGTLAVPCRTLDLSLGGVALAAGELVHLDLGGRDVRIEVDADGLRNDPLRGSVVRQRDERIGVALAATEAQTRALRALIEAAVARTVCSPATLAAWLRDRGLAEPVEIRCVDDLEQAD